LNGSQYDLKNERKPKIIVITASWCGPCKIQTPTINSIAEKYSNEFDFITLFWDLKEDVVKMKSEYNENIKLIPSKLRKKKLTCIEISGFEHCYGFPTVYVLNKMNIIQHVLVGASTRLENVEIDGKTYNVTIEQAKQENYERIEKSLLELIK